MLINIWTRSNGGRQQKPQRNLGLYFTRKEKEKRKTKSWIERRDTKCMGRDTSGSDVNGYRKAAESEDDNDVKK